jgi:hypothetical protein
MIKIHPDPIFWSHLPPLSGTEPTLTLVNAFVDLDSGATDEI